MCRCGCGQSFDVATANRTQRYVDDAHMRTARRTGPAVIGTRVCECGCGASFTVTARRPAQRFLDSKHTHSKLPARVQARNEERQRATRERFEKLVDDLLGSGRITRSALVELVARADRLGYQRAKNQEYRGTAPAQAEAAA